ncbi:FAD-linked oxidase [Catellatospora methionotrophica]|uniref:FAD-linked oxidase n=1 Tax=Catellatospora methionotrophica TaxID=121620 RepID=A0A8J3PJ66_9ACTN|nr:FAD-dependent oxidoreductase [Catellatospora methionotrophica]GIG18198.1 FAD-linked oxidase [Catellatospora methionotrophica]
MIRVARPGEADYASATQVFNLAAPLHPAVAVTARSVAQVGEAVEYAAAHGMPVRVHGAGHASATSAPMEGCLLVRTMIDGGVEVDASRRVARVPAGTSWGAVVEAAVPHGLTAPHGSSPLVGVVGYLLRGGLSFYGRRTGLAVNCLRAIELVTSDGKVRRVDASSDPDLWWAIRGGGGGFGIVTAVEIDLLPMGRVVTGAAFWPAEDAARLLPRWAEWTRHAPRAATTSLRLMRLPTLPGIIPAELSAGPVLCIDGAVSSTGEDDWPNALSHAEELLGPLRSIAAPIVDSWRPATAEAVLTAHLDPPEPVPTSTDHLLLTELDDDGLREFLRVTGPGSGSPLVDAELRQLGGAFAVPDPAGGVLSHVDAPYAYVGAGLPDSAETAAAIAQHHAVVRTALGRWDTGRTAPTFAGRREHPQGHLSPSQLARVDRIREAVDPVRMFAGDIAAHHLRPGSPDRIDREVARHDHR